MAFRCGLRFGVIAGACAFIGAVTASTTAYSTNDGAYTTSATMDITYGDIGNVILVVAAPHEPAFALPAMHDEGAGLGRAFPSYRQAAVLPRASGAAVRPTALVGWRSGHVRRLAVG